jgi:hypothetical protein
MGVQSNRRLGHMGVILKVKVEALGGAGDVNREGSIVPFVEWETSPLLQVKILVARRAGNRLVYV